MASRRGLAQIIWGPESAKARGLPVLPTSTLALNTQMAFLSFPSDKGQSYITPLSLQRCWSRGLARGMGEFQSNDRSREEAGGEICFPSDFSTPTHQATGFLGPCFSAEERPRPVPHRQAFSLPWLRLLDQTQDGQSH